MCEWKKLDPYLKPYSKINSKWIKALNVRPKIIKLRVENGEIFMTLDLAVISWIWHKITGNRSEIDKWHYTKLQNFCGTKETINGMKRQPTEWETIFASYISGKGLMSIIYKEFLQLNNSKPPNSPKKMCKGLE